jgi:hypothetical protein
MSLLHRMIGSVTPPASDAERRQARARALATAATGDWLSVVVRHHQQIEAAFHAVAACLESDSRAISLQGLSRLLIGHAIAEESVLYPALARCGEKRHAEHAYSDQANAKMQLAALEQLPPMSQEFVQQLEEVRLAVIQHHFEEEAHWFIELLQGAMAEDHLVLGQRFQQEFDRYVCSDELVAVLENVPGAHEPADRPVRERSCA